MLKIDASCFVGDWPFHKCRFRTLDDLRRVHETNGIETGYVSSLQSVFWNDPMEAEEELAEALAGSGYRQVCTVNPELPAVEAYLDEAVSRFGIRAVRLCPGYHKYRLNDPCMVPLGRALREHGLPLFVSLRLEDARLNYIAAPRVVDLDELRMLADVFSDVPLLLSQISVAELFQLEELINRRENIYAETSWFKNPTGCLEAVLEHISPEKLLYSSAYPLLALQSSFCEVERAAIGEEAKQKIFSENARRFFREGTNPIGNAE